MHLAERIGSSYDTVLLTLQMLLHGQKHTPTSNSTHFAADARVCAFSLADSASCPLQLIRVMSKSVTVYARKPFPTISCWCLRLQLAGCGLWFGIEIQQFVLCVKQAAMPWCRYQGSDESSRKMYWRLHQTRQPAEGPAPVAESDLTSGNQFANVVGDLDQKVMSEINRGRLREHMWQETMVRAGKPFADLINIPTQLVKELMDLKY